MQKIKIMYIIKKDLYNRLIYRLLRYYCTQIMIQQQIIHQKLQLTVNMLIIKAVLYQILTLQQFIPLLSIEHGRLKQILFIKVKLLKIQIYIIFTGQKAIFILIINEYIIKYCLLKTLTLQKLSFFLTTILKMTMHFAIQKKTGKDI